MSSIPSPTTRQALQKHIKSGKGLANLTFFKPDSNNKEGLCGGASSESQSANRLEKSLSSVDSQLFRHMLKDKKIFLVIDSSQAPEFPIVFAANSFCKFAELSRSEVVGQALEKVFRDSFSQAGEWPNSKTTNMVKKDGSTWLLQLNLVPLQLTRDSQPVTVHAIVVRQAFQCDSDSLASMLAFFHDTAINNSVDHTHVPLVVA
eukprot:c4005_g1_i1.p1 GENE.c4005_g1_i1~~c4005_g1_i1.p1  ORF type:complete len:233 (-),score=53.11 c4005_g1_i1:318-929(-)